jgi:hypothetical protein
LNDAGEGCGNEVKRVLLQIPSKLITDLIGYTGKNSFLLPVLYGLDRATRDKALPDIDAYLLNEVTIIATGAEREVRVSNTPSTRTDQTSRPSATNQRKIIGRVVDEETQKGIANVLVTLPNVRDTRTNVLGFFELPVSDADQSILAQHVSYVTASIKIPKEERFKFSLKKNFSRLNTLFVDDYPVDTTGVPFLICKDPVSKYNGESFKVDSRACPPAGILRFYAMIGNSTVEASKLSDAPVLGVNFTVDETGRVTNVSVSDSTSLLAIPIIRALTTMPLWMPAYQQGVPVSQNYTFLITHRGGPNDEVLINLQRFLTLKIEFPFQAYRDNREGVVNVEFKVDNNGKVSDIIALSDVGHQSVVEIKRALEDVPVADMRSLVKNTNVNKFLLPVIFTRSMPYTKNTRTTGSKAYRLPEVFISYESHVMPLSGSRTAVGAQIFKIDVPSAIKESKRSKTIDLHEQKIKSFPAEIFDVEDLREIELSYNELVELPHRIGTFANLRRFNLSRNHLKTLPNTFDDLRRMERLSLESNDLTVFPEELIHLDHLEFLDLSNNHINDVPDGISSLTKLETLAMNNNQVDKLPNVLFALKGLRQLYLSENKISSLPSTFVDLQDMERLDLSKNKFEMFPPEILVMRKLIALDLSNNNISAIPHALEDLDDLKLVILKGNPIPRHLIDALREKRPDLKVVF